ncbi:MAG: hypothetical protein HY917_02450 [Candidatus Diapherotrites archaeon]|nr:hypothetical protein [Candidatus Diapherotrites archaeon]
MDSVFTYSLAADPDNEILESNESDNLKVRSLDGRLPDFTFEDVNRSPYLLPALPAKLDLLIQNYGKFFPVVNLSVFLDDHLWDSSAITVPVGRTLTRTVYLAPNYPVSRIKAILDRSNQTPESDENNNVLDWNILSSSKNQFYSYPRFIYYEPLTASTPSASASYSFSRQETDQNRILSTKRSVLDAGSGLMTFVLDVNEGRSGLQTLLVKENSSPYAVHSFEECSHDACRTYVSRDMGTEVQGTINQWFESQLKSTEENPAFLARQHFERLNNLESILKEVQENNSTLFCD